MSLLTPTKRLVLRTPHPSARWAKIDTTFSSGNRVSNRGVPLRSENRDLQVLQYSIRRLLSGPYRMETLKFPAPRFP